jgi:triosephosphate isomerase
MTRKPLVAGNWKLHHTQVAARRWCAELEKLVAPPLLEKVDLGVAPPFTSLATVAGAGLPVRLMAQNMHWASSGAFTGEIAAPMLEELGCEMVILGHSERRHVFGETDERIARKVAAAAEAGLVPVLCIGEKEEEREGGRTRQVLETQLRKGLGGVALDQAGVVVAYEPVWAIGTGRVATPEQVDEAHAFIRQLIGGIASAELARRTLILYGGSVKPGNAAGLASLPHVDGFLVGGASLEAKDFHAIAQATAEGKAGA